MVVITPASQGTCLNTSPGAFLPIGDITISEGNIADFAIQTNTTLILSAPAGFSFQPGAGAVSFTASRNITAASLTVTLTTITVTLSVNATSKSDMLVLSGICARSAGSNLFGNILRTSINGGNASIAGNSSGAGVNHGTLYSKGNGASIFSISNGNWSSPSTWSSNSVPFCFDNVTINNIVTADIPINGLASLTITTGGRLIANAPISINGNFNMLAGSRYTHNNTAHAATSIFNGTENFDATSTIEVNAWSAASTPFATGINGNIGNLILNYNAVWEQNGLFAPNKISGDLIVTNGQVVMDNGVGMTTLLSLKNVSIYKTGSIVFAKGANRDLTLNTTSFTDSSKSIAMTALMYNTYGDLVWNNSGNVFISHDFSGIEGSSGVHPANAHYNIGSNLILKGGKVDFARYINGNVNVVVSGSTFLSLQAGSWFHLADYNNANLNYTTTNLLVDGSEMNYLQGSAGSSQYTISGNFGYSGSSLFIFSNFSTNTAPQTFNITNNFSVSSGNVGLANTSGPVDFTVQNNVLLTGNSTMMVGQVYPYSNAAVTFNINQNCNLTNAELNATWNRGFLQFTVGGTLTGINAIFKGAFYPYIGNFAAATFTINNISFNGGKYIFYDRYITDNKTIAIAIGNNANINFLAATDQVIFIYNSTNNNNPNLNFSIGGNLTISGNNAGVFASNLGAGNESISINGNLIIDGGLSSFVGCPVLGGHPHAINTTIAGDLSITNGTLFLSLLNGTALITLNGTLFINGGNLILKQDQGIANLKISGAYQQTGGIFTIHGSNVQSSLADTVFVGGNFTQTNGIFNFDNATGSSGLATHVLNLSAPVFTIGGNGIITHANHLSANTVFGHIIFSANGVTHYLRQSATHDLQQCKYFITPQCTVNATNSPTAFLIASHSSNSSVVHNTLTVNGTLQMGNTQILARQQGNYYSQLSVNAGGKLTTQHSGGLYTLATTGSCIHPLIAGNNRMNYYLDAGSTVEYNGISNQVITGIPNGIASSTQHKYGKLAINFTGIADFTWVTAEADSQVFIRTELQLISGEFNLCTNHSSSATCYSINLDAGATISRTTGYLRSESAIGSGSIRWNILANGSYMIPWAYSSTAFIPVVYEQLSGNSGWTTFSTYHTTPNNMPFPPAVTHVNSLVGADNSLQTVDRFWQLKNTGSPVVNLRFTATPSELAGISTPRAQRWIALNNGWEAVKGIQSNPTANTTQVNAILGLNSWWTLSNISNPLPVDLLAFNANCFHKQIELTWTTASQTNNDFFIIEKSYDGKKWDILTNQKGAGTTTQLTTYKYNDETISEEINYYKLSQVDYDGKHKILKIIAVKNCNANELNLVHSHFTTTKIEAKFYTSYSDEIELILLDNNGRIVARKMQNAVEGINDIEVDVKYCENGIYVLTLQNSLFRTTKKIIKY
jgi:hypothetical protein